MLVRVGQSAPDNSLSALLSSSAVQGCVVMHGGEGRQPAGLGATAFGAAGVEAAVTSAKELITNERNKTYPDRALAALASA